mmetsp:Transcript_25191/g.36186  ORF Transcript_25191/g.36186 Transcript_25191/m.36186 type:complete len:144 (+) Transcript_25191:638-1069(+)
MELDRLMEAEKLAVELRIFCREKSNKGVKGCLEVGGNYSIRVEVRQRGESKDDESDGVCLYRRPCVLQAPGNIGSNYFVRILIVNEPDCQEKRRSKGVLSLCLSCWPLRGLPLKIMISPSTLALLKKKLKKLIRKGTSRWWWR